MSPHSPARNPRADRLAQQVEALVHAETPDAGVLQTALGDLYARYQTQQKLLDRVVRISDGYHRAERDRGIHYQESYEREIRRIEKIIRISDSFQAMLRDNEQELRLAKQHAEQALEDQRHFLAMASHEFKSPLAAIDSSAQLLEILCKQTDRTAPVIERIRRAVRRLSNFLEDCLIEDRLDTQHWTLSGLHFDLVDLLRSTTEQAQQGTERHRIVLTTGTPSLPFYGDPALLRVLLHNLLDNAIKYSPEGGQIHVEAKAAAEAVTLSLTDQGIGITPEDQGRIFSKYVRGQVGGGISGAGLGLYLVSRIATLHQGNIAVRSTPGQGSCFTVTLPVISPPPEIA